MIDSILRRARLWHTFETGVGHGWGRTQFIPMLVLGIAMLVLPISTVIGVLKLLVRLVL